MSDHTQHDEAAQLRAVIYDLKAENKELRSTIDALKAHIDAASFENMQLQKRIAELEAGPKTVEPHIVDPEKWDYTYDGDPVTDLVYDKDEPTYPWGAYSSGRSWTASGQWVDGVSNPARDLIPTPKASKGEQQ
jgi:cell division protein FtsB